MKRKETKKKKCYKDLTKKLWIYLNYLFDIGEEEIAWARYRREWWMDLRWHPNNVTYTKTDLRLAIKAMQEVLRKNGLMFAPPTMDMRPFLGRKEIVITANDIAVPLDPRKSLEYNRLCGIVLNANHKDFIGHRCRVNFASSDGTAEIKNEKCQTTWWTNSYLRVVKK
ncbi:MAG: hypothetical protein NTZ97_04590 [Candidatus Moranbacteria bacterium]|nr:hypothetical protein [Candidatus Moranbacteria bacterium]